MRNDASTDDAGLALTSFRMRLWSRVAVILTRLTALGIRLWRSAAGPSSKERMLLIKLDAIGDFSLCTPVLRELSRSFPHSRITLVVSSSSAPLAELCPYVERVISLDCSDGASDLPMELRVAKLGRTLWKESFTRVLHPRWDYNGYKAYELMCACGAHQLVAHQRTFANCHHQWLAKIERRGAVIIKDAEPRHEVLRNLQLVEALGGTVASDKLELWLSEEDRQTAATWIAKMGLGRPRRLIALGIGAGEARRCWPTQCFAELCRANRARDSLAWVLIGSGEADRRRATKIMELAQCAHISDAVGVFSLRETAALLSYCDVYVGNDSGPMHLASASGVPVVEISGFPRGGDRNHPFSPARFGPWRTASRVVCPDEGTGPIDSHQSESDLLRIEEVSVTAVQDAFLDLMQVEGVL